MQAVLFVILFLVLQQIEGNFIYPRVVGNSVGLSGMWVLLAVAVGGKLFGIVGMFMMVPFASVLYTILREKTHKRLDRRVSEQNLDPEKLNVQPPELRSRTKETQQGNKERRIFRKKSKIKNDSK